MRDDEEDERALLIGNPTGCGPPPKYSSSGQPHTVTGQIQDELPPPYTPTAQESIPMVSCKVCQAMINIEGKQSQDVVKCLTCKEATPIKAAPPGKRYVRCPCNCLLICRSEATRITCPRANCKTIISITPTTTQVIARSPGSEGFTCAHCNALFVFNAYGSLQLARCPYCRRVSSCSAAYVRTRCLIYVIMGIVFLVTGIAVTVGTYKIAAETSGIYIAWAGDFVLGVLFLIRGIYFACMRVSARQEAQEALG